MRYWKASICPRCDQLHEAPGDAAHCISSLKTEVWILNQRITDIHREDQKVRDLTVVVRDQAQHIKILEEEKLASMREPEALTEPML